MAINVLLRYEGTNGSALKFAKEMTETGVVEAIRNEPGNIRYEYYQSLENPEEILLWDCWKDQKAIDEHHDSDNMTKIANLRDKYDLHMKVDRFVDEEKLSDHDASFIRK